MIYIRSWAAAFGAALCGPLCCWWRWSMACGSDMRDAVPVSRSMTFGAASDPWGLPAGRRVRPKSCGRRCLRWCFGLLSKIILSV